MVCVFCDKYDIITANLLMFRLFSIARRVLLSVILFAVALLAAAIFAVNDAAAQSSGGGGIIYKAQPATEVSITADNALVYIGTSEGPVIITVIGITGTFSGGSFTPVATLTPFLVLTLRALKECSISRGCNAFGINAGVGVRGRLAIFLNAGLSTISMYAASGADLNELVQFNDVNSPSLFLLYHLATAMQTAHISVLVGAGASVNAEADNGWTPLFQVANNGGISAIMAILTLSANANHTDNENRTPLHIAAAADNAAAVSALLETGTVDINARDIAGWTPLHFAAGTGTMAAVFVIGMIGICAQCQYRHYRRYSAIVRYLKKWRPAVIGFGIDRCARADQNRNVGGLHCRCQMIKQK